MTMVAGGQNEANKTFAIENFVELTLFLNRFSCGYVTYSLSKFEDGEHFGEVGLRLTPRTPLMEGNEANYYYFAYICSV